MSVKESIWQSVCQSVGATSALPCFKPHFKQHFIPHFEPHCTILSLRLSICLRHTVALYYASDEQHPPQIWTSAPHSQLHHSVLFRLPWRVSKEIGVYTYMRAQIVLEVSEGMGVWVHKYELHYTILSHQTMHKCIQMHEYSHCTVFPGNL